MQQQKPKTDEDDIKNLESGAKACIRLGTLQTNLYQQRKKMADPPKQQTTTEIIMFNCRVEEKRVKKTARRHR